MDNETELAALRRRLEDEKAAKLRSVAEEIEEKRNTGVKEALYVTLAGCTAVQCVVDVVDLAPSGATRRALSGRVVTLVVAPYVVLWAWGLGDTCVLLVAVVVHPMLRPSWLGDTRMARMCVAGRRLAST